PAPTASELPRTHLRPNTGRAPRGNRQPPAGCARPPTAEGPPARAIRLAPASPPAARTAKSAGRVLADCSQLIQLPVIARWHAPTWRAVSGWRQGSLAPGVSRLPPAP